MWWTSSFHSSSRSRAVTVRDGGVESLNVPRTEMPVLPVLNPRTCAPIDAAGDAAVAALVDGPVAVDQEVVADVAPVERLGVVGVDAADDRRSLRGGVAVGAGGVVHERHLDRGVVGRPGAPGLVGAPGGAGHDRRLGRHRRGVGREVKPGDGRGRPAQDADGHGRAVGVLGAVDGHDAHVAQADGGRLVAGAGLRGHLEVPPAAGPDGLGERLLLPALFGDPLERDRVPRGSRTARPRWCAAGRAPRRRAPAARSARRPW